MFWKWLDLLGTSSIACCAATDRHKYYRGEDHLLQRLQWYLPASVSRPACNLKAVRPVSRERFP